MPLNGIMLGEYGFSNFDFETFLGKMLWITSPTPYLHFETLAMSPSGAEQFEIHYSPSLVKKSL